jgi:signal transduction histidine kinase/DNA-binding response OmpR family regulator
MNSADLRILLVEDNPADADLLMEVLSLVDGRVEIVHADRISKAFEFLANEPPVQAVLLDLSLPDSSGLSGLERMNVAAPHLPILVLTGQEDDQLAIESVRHGAQDYLVKGQVRPVMLLRAVYQAIERKKAEERTQLLSEITSRLLASNRPQEVVESICRKAMEHLGCHVFFNFLIDEKAAKLHLNACAGIPEECAEKIEWLDLGKAVCGCAARDRCRVVVECIHENGDPRAELVRSFGVQAYACHPLMEGDHVIGTLSFGSRTKSRFADDELALMKTIADHVSIAMQRVQLMQSLEEHARIAEAANVAKSQFLTNMSHELRTPMNAIMGMTELALCEDLTPTMRDYLETARDSAGMLLELLNEILDFSRIETGFFALEPSPFSLRRILDQTLKTMSVRASEKGLELQTAVPDDLPDQYIGDALRLRQILINLIGNAIKFTPSGNISVKVDTKQQTNATADMRETITPTGTMLQFSVRDTGIGIAEEDRRKVFEPFTQADASTTRNFGGTGLGLAISSSLVRLMGGNIWVESHLGHGSTFFFTVGLEQPVVQRELFANVTSAAPAHVNGESQRPLQILLAEDNVANQKMAVYLLKKHGHVVEITNNGRETVELVNSRNFDLVLMDIQMPIMDGFQATAAIRALPNLAKARMPIIAMTAHSMKGDRERCLAASMDGYLTKPIDSRELLATLASLGNGKTRGEI